MNTDQFPFSGEQDNTSRFADSVDAYTVNNLQNTEEGRKGSQIIFLFVRCLVIAICIGVLCYSAYMIGDKLIEDKLAASAYEDLRVDESEYITVAHATNLKEPNAMPTVLQMLNADGAYEDYIPSDEIPADKAGHYNSYYQNFLEKASQYDNLYGWVYMTGTGIDYPIMKCNDNDYYLTHDYKGDRSRSGSVFADCNLSDQYYSNYNMVVYGHNMKDGSMFAPLKKWCNDPTIKTLVQTTQIEIYTQGGVYIYDIFSYYVDDGNKFASIAFASENDYKDFLKIIYRQSNVRTGRDYNSDSRICTLITCTNGSNSAARYVVHGILNQFIPFE